MTKTYLNPGLPAPMPLGDGLDAPFWEGLDQGKLMIQHCDACDTWQMGPEWMCHNCHSFDVQFKDVAPRGIIYSWQRVWHPVHPSLKDQGAYLVVLVELPEAGNVRLVGNLLGDPMQDVQIGAELRGVIERHEDGPHVYSLMQWELAQ